MPHTYQCIIITKARPIESFEGEKNEVVTQLFKMRQFIPIKWYWYNSFESSSHNMSTRMNNHKMCTKGSFVFLNHVHSYMELPSRVSRRLTRWTKCSFKTIANNIQDLSLVTLYSIIINIISTEMTTTTNHDKGSTKCVEGKKHP